MKSYYRVMLGRGSKHAEACFTGGFIGTDFDIEQDLTGKLPEIFRHRIFARKARAQKKGSGA